MKAVVLSGGGARGAYQAGVLLAVAEIAAQHNLKSPFQIYTGVSAGSINAGFLAAGADDFLSSAQLLAKLWSEIHSEGVFRTDAISIGKIGLSWVGELSFGGMTGATHSRSLLDTSPLADLLRNNVSFQRIQQHIDSKHLHALAITALDYTTSQTITFVQGTTDLPLWSRSRRHAEIAKIGVEHIMASAAIPILFSPVQVGTRFFGDGCVRNQTPLSPALHLGADSLLVIGVRKWSTDDTEGQIPLRAEKPSVARVVNVLLNSVLLDGIETDIERLNRINAFLQQVPTQHQENLNFKSVNYISVHPSEDIGLIASAMSSRLPRIIRYLLKGLGPLDHAAEIISYLLFEPDFCKRLVDLGYEDGMKMRQKIEAFLLEPSA